LLMGQSPEEVENWSFGNYPLRVPEMTNVPQFKKGRAQSLLDTAAVLPFGAAAGGVGDVGQAMLIAGGRPENLIMRSTSARDMVRTMGDNKGRIPNPSFGVTNQDLVMPDTQHGGVFMLPHPRAVDPKQNPSDLFNVDMHTGTYDQPLSINRLGDTRIHEAHSSGDFMNSFALKVASSPNFRSFREFENSPKGGKSLMTPDKFEFDNPPEYEHLYSLIRSFTTDAKYGGGVSSPDRTRMNQVRDNFKGYVQFLKDNPQVAKELGKLQRDGNFDSYAELKYRAAFPVSKNTVQSLVVDGKADTKALKKLMTTSGIDVRMSSRDDPIQQIIDLQKKAKFSGAKP